MKIYFNINTKRGKFKLSYSNHFQTRLKERAKNLKYSDINEYIKKSINEMYRIGNDKYACLMPNNKYILFKIETTPKFINIITISSRDRLFKDAQLITIKENL